VSSPCARQALLCRRAKRQSSPASQPSGSPSTWFLDWLIDQERGRWPHRPSSLDQPPRIPLLGPKGRAQGDRQAFLRVPGCRASCPERWLFSGTALGVRDGVVNRASSPGGPYEVDHLVVVDARWSQGRPLIMTSPSFWQCSVRSLEMLSYTGSYRGRQFYSATPWGRYFFQALHVWLSNSARFCGGGGHRAYVFLPSDPGVSIAVPVWDVMRVIDRFALQLFFCKSWLVP